MNKDVLDIYVNNTNANPNTIDNIANTLPILDSLNLKSVSLIALALASILKVYGIKNHLKYPCLVNVKIMAASGIK
jgi:hypothetical protein